MSSSYFCEIHQHQFGNIQTWCKHLKNNPACQLHHDRQRQVMLNNSTNFAWLSSGHRTADHSLDVSEMDVDESMSAMSPINADTTTATFDNILVGGTDIFPKEVHDDGGDVSMLCDAPDDDADDNADDEADDDDNDVHSYLNNDSGNVDAMCEHDSKIKSGGNDQKTDDDKDDRSTIEKGPDETIHSDDDTPDCKDCRRPDEDVLEAKLSECHNLVTHINRLCIDSEDEDESIFTAGDHSYAQKLEEERKKRSEQTDNLLASEVIVQIKSDNYNYDGVNMTIYDKYWKHRSDYYVEDDNTCHLPEPPNILASVELMKTLDRINAPLYAYNDVIKWATDHSCKQGSFSQKLLTRNAVLDQLAQRYNMCGLKPISSKVKRANANDEINVVTFSFLDCLQSLLTCPYLMQDHKLIFPDPNDPFAPPTKWENIDKSTHYINDHCTGRWYSNTYYKMCVPGRDILCPIIVFLDKTFTDQKSRLCHEPVMFTLGIFNMETRSDHRAWRPLGLIPNFDMLPKAKTAGGRASDYHIVLRHILRELKTAQNKLNDPKQTKGIRHPIYYKGKLHDAVLQIPVACVLGDNEGQDKQCGHYSNRTSKVKSLCRRCNVPYDKTGEGNPDTIMPFKLTTMKAVRLIIDKNPQPRKGSKEEKQQTEKLKKISHYKLTHRNAYWGIDFGADNDGGINQAAKTDSMHTRRAGSQKRIIEGIKIRPRIGKEEIIRNAEARMKDYEQKKKDAKKTKSGKPSKPPEDMVIREARAFSPSVCTLVDDLAKRWGRKLLHQSGGFVDGGGVLGRTSFAKGICTAKESMYNCNEIPGVLLLYLLTFVSSFGAQYFEDIDPKTGVTVTKKGTIKLKGKQKRSGAKEQDPHFTSKTTANYVFIIEEELMQDELFRSTGIMTVEFVEKYLKPYICLYLGKLNEALERKVGAGMNLIKVHLIRHVPDDLIDVGSMRTMDVEDGEKMHGVVKKKSKLTQMSHTSLDKQTSDRLYEHYVVLRAYSELYPPKKKTKSTSYQSHKQLFAEGYTFDVQPDGRIFYRKDKKIFGKRKKGEAEFCSKRLLNKLKGFFRDQLLPQINRKDYKGIRCFSTIYLNNIRYRADPIYYTCKKNGETEGWHDYARVKFNKEKNNVPVKLLLFFELTSHHLHDVEPFRSHTFPQTSKTPESKKWFLPNKIKQPGHYAIVYPFEDNYDPPRCEYGRMPHPQSRILSYGNMMRSAEGSAMIPIMVVIPVESIVGPIIAVPDLMEYKHAKQSEYKEDLNNLKLYPTKDFGYIFIAPKSEWPHILMRHIKETIDEGMGEEDDSDKEGKEGATMKYSLGTKFPRDFDGEIYTATIDAYCPDTGYYHVGYTDGDEEELTEKEITYYISKHGGPYAAIKDNEGGKVTADRVENTNEEKGLQYGSEDDDEENRQYSSDSSVDD